MRSYWNFWTRGAWWEHNENSVGTLWEQKISNTPTPPQKGKKKPKLPRCILPHLTGYRIFVLSTCVLCHFWPRLMTRTYTMGVYSSSRTKYKRWLQCISKGRSLGGGFFNREIVQKFDLKNVVLTNTKDFSWAKWCKFIKFQKENNSNRQISTLSSNR
jgi:hypothetical protein